MKLILPILFACLLFSCSKTTNQQESGLDYDANLKKHLEAIQRRDLNSILSTVGDSVNLIFPNGQKLNSKKEFADFHEGWFKDSSWNLKPTVLRTVKSDSIGYSLIRYQYTDVDSLGNPTKPRSNYLMLLFKRDNEGWKLIHDQNTRIAIE